MRTTLYYAGMLYVLYGLDVCALDSARMKYRMCVKRECYSSRASQ